MSLDMIPDVHRFYQSLGYETDAYKGFRKTPVKSPGSLPILFLKKDSPPMTNGWKNGRSHSPRVSNQGVTRILSGGQQFHLLFQEFENLSAGSGVACRSSSVNGRYLFMRIEVPKIKRLFYF